MSKQLLKDTNGKIVGIKKENEHAQFLVEVAGDFITMKCPETLLDEKWPNITLEELEKSLPIQVHITYNGTTFKMAELDIKL